MKTLAFTLLLSFFAMEAHACPIINGKFMKRESLGEGRTSEMSLQVGTRVLGDEYRYSIFDDSEGFIANGPPISFQGDGITATIRVSCGDDRVRLDWQISNQGAVEFVITRVDENTIQVYGTSMLSMLGGTYRKE